MSNPIQVAHDLKSNTLELTLADDNGVRTLCRNFHPLQIDEFREAAGEYAERYIDLAGWTPEYIAEVKAKEEADAAEKQAQADAEAAEAKAKKEAADKEAFNAEVARQVEIAKAVQAALTKE